MGFNLKGIFSGSRPNSNGGGFFGDILGKVGDTAVKTFDEVAPVWTADFLKRELKINRTDRPTFQETKGRRIQGKLTTQEAERQSKPTNPDRSGGKTINLDIGTILLVGGGVFLGFVLLQGN